ncbi:MAG TPA: hypothetical protein VM802_18140 [Chitinophaga sp.]|uniref:hypothetical protein n=1 Tax=Chitinophaga sp. TaxID=1869181 RepID=UPI002C54D124|nr:hypothetical protein [Chitinophaga sp.]HVI46805.1 hypothetical protein [Chitinophaga sp.]
MLIEIKNVQHHAQLSRASWQFTATLHIDGQVVGTTGNDGDGSPTWYRGKDSSCKPLIAAAERYCALLPDRVLKVPGGRVIRFKQSMGQVIEELFDTHRSEMRRQGWEHFLQQEINRRQAGSFVLYNPHNGDVRSITTREPIGILLQNTYLRNALCEDLKTNAKSYLEAGYQLANTNIPETVLATCNIQPGQLFRSKQTKGPLQAKKYKRKI